MPYRIGSWGLFGKTLFFIFYGQMTVNYVFSENSKPSNDFLNRNSPGLTVHLNERESKLGLRGLETCAVSFNNTPVPEMNVLLGVGHGNEIIRNIFEEQVCWKKL